MMDAFYLAGLAGSVMILIMILVWIIHLPLKNAGIVDIAWAYGLVVIAAVYAYLGEGDPVRRGLMIAMVGIWGLRLGTHLLFRVFRHEEDGRYAALRKEWSGKNIPARFFVFFQLQAVLNIVLSIPFLAAAVNPNPVISPLEWLALGIWVVSLTGESVADYQLNQFKVNPSNRGKTCRAGLWNYSRHPNYFFEWLVWLAFFLMGLASPYGWIGLISPILMLHFLLRVTGIPATEAQALRTRGDDYRAYQQTTSMFVPWFRRRNTVNPV